MYIFMRDKNTSKLFLVLFFVASMLSPVGVVSALGADNKKEVLKETVAAQDVSAARFDSGTQSGNSKKNINNQACYKKYCVCAGVWYRRLKQKVIVFKEDLLPQIVAGVCTGVSLYALSELMSYWWHYKNINHATSSGALPAEQKEGSARAIIMPTVSSPTWLALKNLVFGGIGSYQEVGKEGYHDFSQESLDAHIRRRREEELRRSLLTPEQLFSEQFRIEEKPSAQEVRERKKKSGLEEKCKVCNVWLCLHQG